MIRKPYRTTISPIHRSAQLAYYYTHREEILARVARERRARGINPIRKLTEQERLARVLFCDFCKTQITNRGLLLRGRRRCNRCQRRMERERNWMKGLTCKGVPRKTRTRGTGIPTTLQRQRDFTEMKRRLVCERCGCAKWRILEFHHRNPKEKTFTISNRVTSVTLEELAKEIDKCEVLCPNCHREEHVGIRESS